MSNDYEAMARAMLNTPQGGKVYGQLEKLMEMLGKPEGQKLAEKLANKNGESIKHAAEAASKGDKDGAVSAISKLLSTKEGAMFAKQIMEMMNKK